MKQTYLPSSFILFSLFISTFLSAQDTIRVQTFEWSSDTRSEVFQFPDNPGETYRKIWMKYNMRCHDNLVGSGNVGCREWDYSCNTFVTDSSRVDSTRLMHPSHIVSNFAGDVFGYTAAPVYDYTLYQQHDADLVLTDAAGEKIGNGEEEFKIADNQGVGKIQLLFSADEMSMAGLVAGPVHAIDLFPSQGGQIGFLRIKLKATSKTGLSPLDPDTEGFTEVYFKNTQIVPGAAQRFAFYQPFEWDGVSNVIVELSFTHQPNGPAPAFEATDLAMPNAIMSEQPDHALHFVGSGSVDVPTDNFSTITDEITISLWANGIPEIMPANSTIFSGKDDAGDRQVNVHLPWGNGQVYWDCGNDGTGYDRINKAANASAYEGAWNHWAFTKNANTGEMKIYLNGELFHSGTGKTRPINITDFDIASAVMGDRKYFGSIDEFRVWDKELDQATIQSYMRQPIDFNHNFFDNLVAYFPMDEGAGSVLENQAASGDDAAINLPNWQRIRGKDLYKNFSQLADRPNVAFKQGTATLQDAIIPVLDSVPSAQHSVTFYGVDGTDLVTLDEQNYYASGYSYVVTESGEVVDSVWFEPDGFFEISELTYYDKRPSKYEILSLVTPYGNGLGLGVNGKTFTFDVTDYAPILRGNKRLSIELGGQWQEELDIEFLFIKGTPPRDVQDIQNVWPFRRGYYGQIQSDQFFEPRMVSLSENGEHFKLRSSSTGHGQNGEFVPRTHYLNINGGAQDFTYQVWKECADNPIYPQGGTWIFDRAGWCPGAATDVHEFDITDLVTQGGAVEIDYGVNGASLDQANYLVSTQLVTYGPDNFNLDASMERIARPNASDVEFERINPACASPLVWVKNTGASPIGSLTIEYQVKGNPAVQAFEWVGDLLPGAQIEIELPVTNVGFWETSPDEQIFEARIAQVNGVQDDYPANNLATSAFELATVFQNDDEHVLVVRTNNKGFEYSYTIKNSSGEIMMERDNMMNNTTYKDALDLPAGCYTMKFNDAGDDGLSFWFFPGNGNGSLSINKYFTPTILLPIESFDPDFGTGVQFDFVIEEVVAADEDQKFRAMSTYPNPASRSINVELRGFEGQDIELELTNLQGIQLFSQSYENIQSATWRNEISLEEFPSGMYFMKVKSAGRVWVNEFVKY